MLGGSRDTCRPWPDRGYVRQARR